MDAEVVEINHPLVDIHPETVDLTHSTHCATRRSGCKGDRPRRYTLAQPCTLAAPMRFPQDTQRESELDRAGYLTTGYPSECGFVDIGRGHQSRLS